nr:pyrroline-5-carboxylate reductase dimerization domain-containing protein [Candidatus Fimenecus sp.]
TVKNGMNKSVALEIAAQTVLGSAKKILESDEHPWELIDKVCSPGGTTIEGIVSLQKDGFESAVCNAVDAALQIKLFITKCIFFGRPLGGRPFLCYGTFVLRAVPALRFHIKISRAY